VPEAGRAKEAGGAEEHGDVVDRARDGGIDGGGGHRLKNRLKRYSAHVQFQLTTAFFLLSRCIFFLLRSPLY
jgi:hypothetical protein